MSETIEGGYYLNPDGKSAHDANGKALPLRKTEAPKQAENVTPESSAPAQVDAKK